MKKHASIWPLVGLAAVATVVLAVGCNAPARETAKGTTAGGEKPQAFVNVTCPIMGSAIDPKNVAPELVRLHKGKKVAFCCGGCPVAWDKLSEAQKDAKLREAASGKKAGGA